MIKKFRSNLCFMVWWLKFEQENTDDHWVIFLLNDDCSSWLKFCSFILLCSKANIKDLILLSGLLLTSVFMLRKKTVSPKHTPAYWKKMLHSRKGPFILRYSKQVGSHNLVSTFTFLISQYSNEKWLGKAIGEIALCRKGKDSFPKYHLL
jgi:hypothetical protein